MKKATTEATTTFDPGVVDDDQGGRYRAAAAWTMFDQDGRELGMIVGFRAGLWAMTRGHLWGSGGPAASFLSLAKAKAWIVKHAFAA